VPDYKNHDGVLLSEEITEWDEKGNPIEKTVISVNHEGDIDLSNYHRRDGKWVQWYDQGSIVSASLFLKSAENLLALADDE